MDDSAPIPVPRFLDRLREPEIANIAGVSTATVSRWGSGRKSPHPRTQLLFSDRAYVVIRLGDYCRPDEIHAWLFARHPQLDGERPVDLIHDDHTEEVLAILDRLDAVACL